MEYQQQKLTGCLHCPLRDQSVSQVPPFPLNSPMKFWLSYRQVSPPQKPGFSVNMSLYLALRHSWVSSQSECELHCHRKIKRDTDLVWIREVVESFRGIAKWEVISSLEVRHVLEGAVRPWFLPLPHHQQTDSFLIPCPIEPSATLVQNTRSSLHCFVCV